MATFKSISIPSVIESYNLPLINVASSLDNHLQIYENGVGYLVGNLALAQGVSPYRNINSSPGETDYQLLAKAGILVANENRSGEVVITTGFPFTTYELFKQQAYSFFTTRDVMVEYNGDTYVSNEHKRMQVTVKRLDVMPEIMGCINAIRKGPIQEKGNFFIVSLGYGTCETALSTEGGLITRTCLSVNGLRHAVTGMCGELSKTHNLSLKNEHMVNQSFQNGKIVVDRKRKDLLEIRRKYLSNYYNEIISPALRKAFTDLDFEKTDTMYLVGGGATYTDLVSYFHDEFDDILEIIVPENPSTIASQGYCLNSQIWSGEATAVGLDIGNAYTVVTTGRNNN